MPEPEKVEPEDKYFHIWFNDPDNYDTIRAPDRADNLSDSVSNGKLALLFDAEKQTKEMKLARE